MHLKMVNFMIMNLTSIFKMYSFKEVLRVCTSLCLYGLYLSIFVVLGIKPGKCKISLVICFKIRTKMNI